FYIAGHSGAPALKHTMKNIVRLRDSQSNDVLAEAPAPRNDTAQKVGWELGKFAGRSGYIEATDADTGTAYAWIAFGRFDPPVVQVPLSDERPLRAAIEMAAALHLTNLSDRISGILADRKADTDNRAAAA